MWYVYIIKSLKNGQTYKGFTNDLERRIREHNKEEPSSHSDKTLGPFELIWFCGFKSKEKAVVFERYLKSGSGRAFSAKHLL